MSAPRQRGPHDRPSARPASHGTGGPAPAHTALSAGSHDAARRPG
ncbi:hypothetical protein [Streptomyces sp. SID8352]|nr:hypothetical protein [Streptomyces sp. SID8352]